MPDTLCSTEPLIELLRIAMRNRVISGWSVEGTHVVFNSNEVQHSVPVVDAGSLLFRMIREAGNMQPAAQNHARTYEQPSYVRSAVGRDAGDDIGDVARFSVDGRRFRFRAAH